MPWEGKCWAEVYCAPGGWARPTTPSLHDLHPRVPLTTLATGEALGSGCSSLLFLLALCWKPLGKMLSPLCSYLQDVHPSSDRGGLQWSQPCC